MSTIAELQTKRNKIVKEISTMAKQIRTVVKGQRGLQVETQDGERVAAAGPWWKASEDFDYRLGSPMPDDAELAKHGLRRGTGNKLIVIVE